MECILFPPRGIQNTTDESRVKWEMGEGRRARLARKIGLAETSEKNKDTEEARERKRVKGDGVFVVRRLSGHECGTSPSRNEGQSL